MIASLSLLFFYCLFCLYYYFFFFLPTYVFIPSHVNLIVCPYSFLSFPSLPVLSMDACLSCCPMISFGLIQKTQGGLLTHDPFPSNSLRRYAVLHPLLCCLPHRILPSTSVFLFSYSPVQQVTRLPLIETVTCHTISTSMCPIQHPHQCSNHTVYRDC